MPKISIVVPVYKVEPYLRRCVDSILGQSYQDFELILVDDGSPDNCGAICDEYAARDGRIHVIHQENGGLSAARNSGIDWTFANSDSQWIAFIDSDDWIHKDFLRLLVGAAEQHGVKVTMGDHQWTDVCIEDPDFSGAVPFLLDAEDAMVQHYSKCTPAWGKIYARELYTDLRFPVGKLYEDAYVTHIAIFASEKVAVFEEKLCYYYYNPNSITRAKWSDRKLDSIEAHEQRLAFFREHGWQKAYLREWEIYVEELTNKLLHLVDTRASEEDHRDTYVHLRKKLRIALKEARKMGLIQWNGETMWSYFFALPTDAVWKTARVLQKCYHKIRK